MSEYLIKDTTLRGLADEIRRETGKSDPLPGASMTDELRTFSDSLTEEIALQNIDLDDLEAELSDLEEKEDLAEEIALQDADLLYLEAELSGLEEKEDLAEEISLQNIDLVDLEAELLGLENKEDLTEEITNQGTDLTNLETELNGLEEGIRPEGSLSITENGTFDVTHKESVEVNVSTDFQPSGSLTITENGTYDVANKASVSVNTPVPEGTLSITENGTYDVAYKASVEVNTPVPEGTLSITENGTHDVSYKASVEVNVENRGMFTPSTEDEMEALLATDTVDQAVRYIGDNVYVDGVPFQVGDKITRVYFNPSVEIPISFFESLPFANSGSSESIRLFSDQWQGRILDAYSLPGHGDNGEHVYCLEGFGASPLYSTARMGSGVFPTNKGWCAPIGVDYSHVNFSEGYVDQTWYASDGITIAEINTPSDIFKYISKESMLEVKYEKDALYLIVEEDEGAISTRRLGITN